MDEHVLDETHEPEALVTLEPGDVPPEQRHAFRFDPVLAMFEGPWIVRRSPGLGTAVRCAAITILLAIIAVTPETGESSAVDGSEIEN